MLACAVGAYWAVTVAWSAVERPHLPYGEAEELVHLEVRGRASQGPGREHLFRDEIGVLITEADSFAWVGHWFPTRVTLGARGARVVRAARVDRGLLDALRVVPHAGRLFHAEDHASRGGNPGLGNREAAQPVVVLAHDLAAATTGSAEAAVGTEIVLDGQPVRVIGVVRPDFFFPDRRTEAWLPAPERPWRGPGGSRTSAPTFARLRAEVSPPIAGEEATALLRVAQFRPEDQRIVAIPAAAALTRPVRPTIALLRAGTLLLVVAAAASVAALRLARAGDEGRKAAIRRSLGATPADEFAVSAARVAFLAGSVGALGWLVSFAVLPVLEPFAGEFLQAGAVNRMRLVEAAALTLLAVTITEAPAGLEHLQSRPAHRSPRAERSRGLFLLAGGAATSVVILIATAAVGRSAWSLLEGNASYPSAGLAQLTVDFRGRDFVLDPTERGRILEQLARRIEALPEVEAAAWADQMPDARSARYVSVMPRVSDVGASASPAGAPSLRLRIRAVSPGFLELLGIPILGGRGLLRSDDPPAPPVALADRHAIRAAGLGNALGEFLNVGTRQPQVVGRVPAVAAFPAGPEIPTIYLPFAVPRLHGPDPSAVVGVRYRNSPDTEDLTRLATIAGQTDPSLRTLGVESVRDRRRRGLGAPASAAWVLGVFAVCGILMAVAGAVGQVSDYASRAARSLAIRKAVGAPADWIVWATVQGAFAAAGLAVLAGVSTGWLLVRWIGSRVVWVQTGDPFLYLGPAALVALLFVVAALAAGLRASRTLPWPLLRSD